MQLLNPTVSFANLQSLSTQQQKHPQIRQILKNYNHLSSQQQRTDAMVSKCANI
jgi:hypothetical protein